MQTKLRDFFGNLLPKKNNRQTTLDEFESPFARELRETTRLMSKEEVVDMLIRFHTQPVVPLVTRPVKEEE